MCEHLPKTIWFSWLQGIEQAPYVVQRCHDSWSERNPGWAVRLVDQKLAEEATCIDFSTGNLARLSPTHRSDLIRLKLLSDFGGVWADATTFCVQPLDDWLPPLMPSGFFAFDRPARERLIANWFIASKAGNPLTSRFYEALLEYWEHRFYNETRRFALRVLTRLLGRSLRTADLWFSHPVRDWVAVYPYFSAHYIFNRLVATDEGAAKVWQATPKVPARGPLQLLSRNRSVLLSAELRADIDRKATPLYKLDRRLTAVDLQPDHAMGYLLKSRTE